MKRFQRERIWKLIYKNCGQIVHEIRSSRYIHLGGEGSPKKIQI